MKKILTIGAAVAVLGFLLMMGGSKVSTASAADCLSNDYIGGPDMATGQTIVKVLSAADVPGNVGTEVAQMNAAAFNEGFPAGIGPVLGSELALVMLASDPPRTIPMFVVAQAGPPGEYGTPGGGTVTASCIVTFEDPSTGKVLFSFANQRPTAPYEQIGGGTPVGQ